MAMTIISVAIFVMNIMKDISLFGKMFLFHHLSPWGRYINLERTSRYGQDIDLVVKIVHFGGVFAVHFCFIRRLLFLLN